MINPEFPDMRGGWWYGTDPASGESRTVVSMLINDPIVADIVKEILDEMRRSKEKHPNYPTDQLRRTAITLEETLEAMIEFAEVAWNIQNSALHIARVGNEEKFKTYADLKKELTHCAAMCVKQLEALAREPLPATAEPEAR